MAGLIAVVGIAVGYTFGGEGTPPSAPPVSAVGAASAGCGRAPSPGPTARVKPGGDVVESLRVDGATRSYRLAVPSRRQLSSPTPLILLFHGSGSNAVQTSLYTQLPRRGAQAGYLVATPDGIGGRWDLTAPDGHSADLDFVTSLIATLSDRYCVDRSRIDAAGISLGSEFSAIVGCTSADRIAAIGLVAADFPLRPCRSPLPLIAFHGTADPIVPYQHGGLGLFLPGVHVAGTEADLASWAQLNRCRPVPRIRSIGTMVVRRIWPRCRADSAVVLYTVLGGGHTWPGSPVTLSAGTFGATTHQIDATGLMLRFFAQHRFVG